MYYTIALYVRLKVFYTTYITYFYQVYIYIYIIIFTIGTYQFSPPFHSFQGRARVERYKAAAAQAAAEHARSAGEATGRGCPLNPRSWPEKYLLQPCQEQCVFFFWIMFSISWPGFWLLKIFPTWTTNPGEKPAVLLTPAQWKDSTARVSCRLLLRETSEWQQHQTTSRFLDENNKGLFHATQLHFLLCFLEILQKNGVFKHFLPPVLLLHRSRSCFKAKKASAPRSSQSWRTSLRRSIPQATEKKDGGPMGKRLGYDTNKRYFNSNHGKIWWNSKWKMEKSSGCACRPLGEPRKTRL